MQGYNWEENESNMWPAMLFHGNIKAHIYKSAHWQTSQQYHADIKIQSLDKLKIMTRFLTQMSLLMMISNEKMQIRIFETFPTNLRMCNASWPKTKNQCFHNTASMCSRRLYRKNNAHPLTIPVNNIDTIPDRPRPSASMYLERMNVWIKLHQKSRKDWKFSKEMAK
jgi:hypothetical protein